MRTIGRVVGSSVALGGAAFVALRRRRRRRRTVAADPVAPVATGGRSGRSGELTRTAGRVGVSYGLHQARRTFASAGRRERLDLEFAISSAEQVTETLGNLKGVMMKLGQMASYLDLGLPDEMREVLAALQSAAPPMTPELATATVQDALGMPVGEAFAEWDPVPIAAASIGQVHRAITRDGEAVAVKVQYPGIAEAIESDLAHTDALFAALGIVFPALERGPLVEELTVRLGEELDYVTEARNQQFFADHYRGHPFVCVPDTVPELSNDRVLTSELLDGRRFAELGDADQAERDRVGEVIFRYVMRSLYRMDAFNGDPHPGNYLILDDGRVAFVDYGLVKYFRPDETEMFAAMHRAMVDDRDPVAFRRLLADARIVGADAPISDERLHEYFSGFYGLLAADGATTVTSEFTAGLVARMFDTDGPFADIHRYVNVPPSFLMIQRINLGLYALLAQLGATAPWRAVLGDVVPWVEGPPATALGVAEARWERDRPAR